MREMEFKMERAGQVNVGDIVEITESKLPTSYYYTLEPAVAMSANFSARERLQSRSGKVKDIHETKRGFFVTVEFDE